MLKLENVLTREEIARIRVELSRVDFYDGAETGFAAHKKNLQVDQVRKPQLAGVTGLVLDAVMRNTEFTNYVWPHKVTLAFNRYDSGMRYKGHADAALMGESQSTAVRVDCSFTLFLTDPDTYDGGELVMETPFGNFEFKEKQGTAIVYDSLYVHGVKPVTRGSRVSAVGWVQSFIKNPIHRQSVADMYKVHRELALAMPDSDIPPRLDQALQNLMRGWIEN